MSAGKVRIVGGGLTGVLAAFEALRLGYRDIELLERFDQLGGSALSRQAHGLELRDRRVYFGAPGDPARSLLESAGLRFEDFENRFGSVSCGAGGELAIGHDFAGPVLRSRSLDLSAPTGDSLADRIRAYPSDIAGQLNRYCQWSLGVWLDEIHTDAVCALGIERVHPTGSDLVQLARLKRAAPLYDDFYGIPRAMWGRLKNATASLPEGGLVPFFRACRRELERAGVKVRTETLASPRELKLDHRSGDLLVWAADAAALYKPAGLEPPTSFRKAVASYTFKARYAGPAPFYVRNFTAEGAVSQIYVYESRGQILFTAECVAEVADGELRREIHRLMSVFGGASLVLGEAVAADHRTRSGYPSMAEVRGLDALRTAYRRELGPGFVLAGRRFEGLRMALAAAHEASPSAVAA